LLIDSSRCRKPKRQVVATYPYRDAEGNLLYEVVRYDPKGFRQRRPNGNGGWIGNLRGVPRVLYPQGRTLRLAKAGQIRSIRLPDGEVRIEEAEIERLLATGAKHGGEQ